MRRANIWQRRRQQNELNEQNEQNQQNQQNQQNEPAPLNITIDLTEDDDDEENSVSLETRSSVAQATEHQNSARSSSNTWEVINLCGETDSVQVERVQPSGVARPSMSHIENDNIEYFNVDSMQLLPDSPKISYDEPRPTCPICMINLVEADSVLLTKCGHMFCKDCILPSLERLRVCPLCRQKVSKNQLISVYLNAK